MPWDLALILLVLAVVVPWRGAARIKQLLARPQLATADRLTLYASTIAFQWLAVAVTTWRSFAHGFTPARLGLAFGEPELTTAITLALAVILGANQFFSLRRLARFPAHRQGFLHQLARKLMPQTLVEALAFVALVVTVALCEEFLYRGFAFAALQQATGSELLAALASSAMFALAHLYQGRRGLATTFIVGLIFAGARILTASLAPSIVAHLLADLLAGLAAPRLLAATHNQDRELTRSDQDGSVRRRSTNSQYDINEKI